ncbi:hypothetical protein ACFSYD_08530 [Paracoccus aerius]
MIAAIDAHLSEALDEPKTSATVTLPFSDGRRRAWLHEAGVVEREESGENGVTLHLLWTDRQKAGFAALNAPDEDEEA